MAFRVILVVLSSSLVAALNYCQPGQLCWPTPADIAELRQQLQEGIPPGARARVLKNVPTKPRVCAVPILSPDDQPLYGAGVRGLDPVYVQLQRDRKKPCYVDNTVIPPLSCNVSVRNTPYEDWQPAFTVFPVTARHVQAAVAFAREHQLCIAVAGPGHDFLNRHSCDGGVLIRTSLMKGVEWDLQDRKRLGAPDGSAKWGPGVVWNEVQVMAAEKNRFVSSGWSPTVGIVGWHLGGGRGPFTPAVGYGVDNILELEVVTADGTLVKANKRSNADLYWAMRGGGGSTWGVVTSITTRVHRNPPGGFTFGLRTYSGDLCPPSAGSNKAHQLVDSYIKYAQHLNTSIGGFLQITTTVGDTSSPCGVSWSARQLLVYQGQPTDKALADALSYLTVEQDTQEVSVVSTFGEFLSSTPTDYIYPVAVMAPSATSAGGAPSVFVQRSTAASGTLARLVKRTLDRCTPEFPTRCGTTSLFDDLTGRHSSPRDRTVAIHPEMRTALLLWVIGGQYTAQELKQLYRLAGGAATYFSESAYEMSDWAQRYWGPNYERLQQIKTKYDPRGVFGCRHCVAPMSPGRPAKATNKK